MKAAIIYCSGTGNTFRVGELFKELLMERGYDVDLVDISSSSSEIKRYDLLVFGTPTRSKVASVKMTDYIERNIRLENNKSAEAITFITHSWGQAFGHITLSDKLQNKGFKVVSALAYLMPNNHYAMTGKKHSQSEMTEMYKAAIEKTQDVITSYENGKGNIEARSTLKKAAFGKMYTMLQKKWIPNYAQNYLEVDESKCTKCNLCVKQCPSKNIKVDNGTIIFGSNCLACAKCFNTCPVNAYRVNKKTIERYTENTKSIRANINM